MAAGDTRKVLLENTDGEYLIPYTEVASSNTVGRVKPDGTSTIVDANGVISVASAIQSGAAAGATAVQPSGVGNAEIEIQKNGTKVDSFTTNQSGSKKTINITVPTSASDVSALPSSTKYGASIDLSLDTTDYKLTLTLKDQDGTTLNSKVVDFPIESVVVNGSYDSTNQKIILTLQNGNTIDIPVGALISGLQSEITSSNKLDADLVDDSTSTNKFVTTSEKNTWSGKQDTSTAVTHTASTAVGSGTQPVYIASDGAATATTYALNKTVPSDAVFTDTTYSVFTGADGTTAGTAGLVKAPAATDNTKFLKGDGTWDLPTAQTAFANITGQPSDNTNLANALNAKQDIATAVNYDNITNCITEIPQDIKLELNNGTLTLKAGSKVYVPNGAGVFDTITIANDIAMNGGRASGTEFVYLTANGASLYHYLDNSSGTDWTATSQYQCRYNTTDNMIKNTNNTGSTWLSQLSFPIAKVTLSSGTVTSIDQVFNGFGYIGSTVFALPGVKGLIPNGRNADGTLKNTEIITNNVLTYTNTDTPTGNYYIQLRGNFISRAYANPNSWRYDEERNIILWNNTAKQEVLFAGNLVFSSGRVESLTPKVPFHAVDYNDFSDLKDTVDNDVVNLTGNQNISGTKTFTETVVVTGTPINFIAQNNAIVKGETPTTNQYCGYDFRGANGDRLAYLGVRYGIDGGKVLELQRLDTNLTKMNSAFPISAPTPAIDDNSTIVATTAFVKSNLNNIPHIIETYVNGTSWYRVYSDGWCEQGGHWNSSSDGFQTITLLKPYKDTNYNVQVTVAHTGATYTTGAAPCYYSAAYKTVSSFQCYGYSDASLANKDWMACGYIN